MMNVQRLVIALAVMVLLGGLIYKGYEEYMANRATGNDSSLVVADGSEALGGLDVGQVAPDFELDSTTGESVRLASFRGQMVVVNFWASWCPPCREELPELIEFSEATGTPVLGVNVTKNEKRGRTDVDAFLKEVPVDFPVLLDEDATVEKLYRVVALPTTYVIDEDGVIVAKQVGPVDGKWLNESIQP